ncbi:MAG: hypothetical protein V1821_00220, partial [bacterium]
MTSQAKTCQNCKQSFIIEPEDFEFYEKMQVPPPTWCPECRLKRRLIHEQNLRSRHIYKRACSATGKTVYTFYPEKTVFPVYDRSYWFSDNWDPLDYGQNYDSKALFFVQFQSLRHRVPRPSTHNRNSENCDYCLSVTNCKNCYLCTGYKNVNSCYVNAAEAVNSAEVWFGLYLENCYECFNWHKSYRLYFSYYSRNCSDSAFLYDCSNCSYCFGCHHLKNKQYYFFNQPHSKEEYERLVGSIDLGDFKVLEEYKKKFRVFCLTQPRRFANIFNSENVSGNDINDAVNCFDSFEVFGAEDCRYIMIAGLSLK